MMDGTGMAGTVVITVRVFVNVLREENVDIDSRLCSLTDAFHRPAVAIAHLSDAHTCTRIFYEWTEESEKGKISVQLNV